MSDFDLDEAIEGAEFDSFDESPENNDDVVEGELVEHEDSSDLYVVSEEELNEEEAKELTENIRSTGEVLYVLVSRAHAGKAHNALGYSSFEAYVKEEFGMSRSRAYQLIGQANVIQEITDAVPEGTKISISEAAARDLKGILDQVVPAIADRTSGMNPDEASSELDSIINESRQGAGGNDADLDDMLSDADIDALLKQDLFGDSGTSFDEEFMGDLQDREGFSASAGGNPLGNGGGGGGGGDFGGDSGMPDDDFDLSSFEFDDDDSSSGDDEDVDYEAVYDFYSFLRSINTWPEPEVFITKIAEARKRQVTDSIGSAVEWMEKFNELWSAQVQNEGGSDSSDESDDFEE